jgi:hypothetical protein
MKMVSVGQKLSITVNRGKNKVACLSKEITEAKAETHSGKGDLLFIWFITGTSGGLN